MFLEKSLDLPKSTFSCEIAKQIRFKTYQLPHACPDTEEEQSEIVYCYRLKILFHVGIPHWP